MDAFHRASWSEAWTGASYYQLAELAGLSGQWSKSLSDLDQALDYGTLDCRAWDLKASALRKLGRNRQAEKAAEKALAVDPLNFWAANELRLLNAGGQPKIGLGNPLQANLELAVNYDDAGLAGDSEQVLKRFVASTSDRNKVNPLVYYYLGYLAAQGRRRGGAAHYFHLAAGMPSRYVFPFRLETVNVLDAALKADRTDAHADYYLGNVFYYLQRPSAAIQMWQKAVQADSSLALAWRNLAFAYEHAEKDTPKAIVAMQKAVRLDKNDAMLLYELDKLYETTNVSPAKRLASLDSNPSAVSQRSDTLTQETKLYILLGRYNQAIQLLKTHEFHNWEGEGRIHDVYMNVYLLKGEKEFQAGRYQEALEDFKASLLYPENLEVGQPYRQGRLPQVDYLTGSVYEKLGDTAESRQLFHRAVNARWGGDAMEYYRGLAALKLGQKAAAQHFFDNLIAKGEKLLAGSPEAAFFAKFGQGQSDRYRLADAHYLIGLGNLGKGEAAKARTEFHEAAKLDVGHLGAVSAQAMLPAGEELDPPR